MKEYIIATGNTAASLAGRINQLVVLGFDVCGDVTVCIIRQHVVEYSVLMYKTAYNKSEPKDLSTTVKY